MKNYVVAGDYQGHPITNFSNQLILSTGIFKSGIRINKSTVASYELNDSQHHNESEATLFGHRSKDTNTHMVVLNFTDGKRSLLEVEDAIYKAIVAAMF